MFDQFGNLAHSEATHYLHTAACKLTELPKCAACQFGEQKLMPAPGKSSSVEFETRRSSLAGPLGHGTASFGRSFCLFDKGQIAWEQGKDESEHHVLWRLHLH